MKWSEVKVERLKAQIDFGNTVYKEMKADGKDYRYLLEMMVEKYEELVKELEKKED